MSHDATEIPQETIKSVTHNRITEREGEKETKTTWIKSKRLNNQPPPETTQSTQTIQLPFTAHWQTDRTVFYRLKVKWCFDARTSCDWREHIKHACFPSITVVIQLSSLNPTPWFRSKSTGKAIRNILFLFISSHDTLTLQYRIALLVLPWTLYKHSWHKSMSFWPVKYVYTQSYNTFQWVKSMGGFFCLRNAIENKH